MIKFDHVVVHVVLHGIVSLIDICAYGSACMDLLSLQKRFELIAFFMSSLSMVLGEKCQISFVNKEGNDRKKKIEISLIAHDTSFNPLHPNISIYLLHTPLSLFLLVLTRRIHLKIKTSKVGDRFLYSLDLNEWFSCIIVRRNLMLITPRV